MSENKAYTSKKVFKKAIFNIAFQIVPIAAALILTPLLINGMGKDFWAKYSTGISLIFLSNYFSFGIGPALNRRVSEIIGLKKHDVITKEFRACVSVSYLLGIGFFLVLQLGLFLAFRSNGFSILKTLEDYYFYTIVVFNFLLVFTIIPYRSLLESFSDFYFLAIVRAITAAMLFIMPFVIINITDKISLFPVAIGLFGFYGLVYLVYFYRVKKHAINYSFRLLNPLAIELIGSIFKFDLGFIKETFYFSLFFLASAVILFFDRFYYPVFFDTIVISDQVTLLDLFNRVAIVTGTLSLVYFSAISVWYQEKNLQKIRKNILLQLTIVIVVFAIIIAISYFFLQDILLWWLGESYSQFIITNAFPLLIGALAVNFTILLVRPLQAIGYIKESSLWLLASTLVYVCVVTVFGLSNNINYHFVALLGKAGIDIVVFSVLMKRKKLL